MGRAVLTPRQARRDVRARCSARCWIVRSIFRSITHEPGSTTGYASLSLSGRAAMSKRFRLISRVCPLADRNSNDHTHARLLERMTIARSGSSGALLVRLAVGLADRLGRSIVRPLQALEEVTHRLRDGDLDRRHEPAGPYEVAEVGQAVNELADRITSLLATTRIAAADLGHRLRTPLTALRLDVDAVTDGSERARLAATLDTLENAVSRLILETRQAPQATSRHADLSQ